jgi:hypothetical protein
VTTVGFRRVAALLAELIVTGALPDDGQFAICWKVDDRELSLLYNDPSRAQTVAARVLHGADARTYDRHVSQAGNVHYRWRGLIHGVPVEVTGLAPDNGIPDDLDPLGAVDEDDYLRRLIAVGLVVDE